MTIKAIFEENTLGLARSSCDVVISFLAVPACPASQGGDSDKHPRCDCHLLFLRYDVKYFLPSLGRLHPSILCPWSQGQSRVSISLGCSPGFSCCYVLKHGFSPIHSSLSSLPALKGDLRLLSLSGWRDTCVVYRAN